MSKKNSFLGIFVTLSIVLLMLGGIADWNVEDFQEIGNDILIKSVMAMTATWLILATSSTSILHRGSAPVTQTIILLFLSIGGLGLFEILNGEISRGMLATITVQWVSFALGAIIVIFTVLAIVTRSQENEEDPLLAMDK
ncbi:MAG: hypothetical protein VXW89_01455 [Candidatus Thermoplasmatota archaeon]|nr:hypothetical protein [Candidatus Thermoplasmatota archaeon]MEC7390924.1 hypothetical protein [Candidatus Thermoplasmatota archaeon]MEC7435831.1 hypothetical protein [Candidatus Thermoplasmatota archaeon]MEC7461970.1 hypothetical protein [Candidatus Thermoplasmatota archaeon]MEC7544689.1 hypothetical protein [Candidatus Thermoplasmatota archaeon]|tara:strand:- start:193 stop:612 length:420 start_codon:yes stop_codon:yes gene_type:complete